jgi:hypothetical protein
MSAAPRGAAMTTAQQPGMATAPQPRVATASQPGMAAAASARIIFDTANGFRASRVLQAAVELGVFNALAGGPLDVSALVTRLRLNGRGARDFLDALVALRLIERDAEYRYRNGEAAARFLERNGADYLGDAVEYLARVYESWAGLASALRTGRPQAGPFAAGGFEDFYGDERARDLFIRGMSAGSLLPARALADALPWSEYRTMVDVGTAEGCVPVEIARRHPHLHGGGFDLPSLQRHFERYVEANALSDRLRFHAGDFRSDPLPPADVVILGRILHDWDVALRRRLLERSNAAVLPGGAVVVWEAMIDDDRCTDAAALLSSLNMLVQTDAGSECTPGECASWIRAAGFTKTRVVTLTAPFTAVIGFKDRGG